MLEYWVCSNSPLLCHATNFALMTLGLLVVSLALFGFTEKK